jgi:putative protease
MTSTPAAPELLAPAGDRLCVRAAIENGADAVYFGLQSGFNARARASNLPVEELPEVMAQLHERGVRGYTTVNTLVFTDELEEFERLVLAIARAGVDAILVQDLGVVRLVREICPELEIHASTQMTMTSSETIAVAAELGVSRVVLARELSLDEIRKIHSQTTMPLEVFVHGALCVAYSGQCLTSESLGGRSANRGQCAQACRMPYQLVCDGKDVDLGDVKYLLSPQDLAAYDLVPQLIDVGVASFKIEGRLKSPEYVANITQRYRQAIDAAVAARPIAFSPAEVEEMELSFSRGFSPGWLGGCDHKLLVPGRSSAKRGVLLGQVIEARGGRVQVQLQTNLAPGDGVVFQGDRAGGDEQGGRVYEIFIRRQRKDIGHAGEAVEVRFAGGAIDPARLYCGQPLWKTDDPKLTARLRKTFASADPLRRVPVDLSVFASPGEPLRVEAVAASGAACVIESAQPVAVAERHPMDEALLCKHLGRLGGTVYELRNITATIEGRVMLPLSVLGAMRKELIERLNASAQGLSQRDVQPPQTLAEIRRQLNSGPIVPPASGGSLALHILCRSLAQLGEVLAAGERSIYADFADIREYRDAVELAQAHGATMHLATPRIQKPNEMGIFRALAKHPADGWLVRNLSGMEFCREHGIAWIADFSLNATNELTVDFLRQKGAQRVTASYDMNREQLLALCNAAPAAALEIVVHQHMPMFHMEHCVFCAVLSPGTNKTNCGRPCDVHAVRLRDHIGMEHPLTADVGCRNTLFNAVPQSAAEAVPQLIARGVKHLRVELLNDHGDELRSLLAIYRALLAGNSRGQEVWRKLRASNRVGVTRGTLEERRNPLAII